jgi:hypothetical protein
MPTLSGASWVSQFPTSAKLDDLKAPFQEAAQKFLAALTKAGAHVTISATYRPPERAYLMHYSFLIAKKTQDPTKVPAMAGVDIDWVHLDGQGETDLQATLAAASAMVQGYETVFLPVLTSRHTQGLAIDMDITWTGPLTIEKADGTSVTIQSTPRSNANTELQAVAATYTVHKLATDPPHWSSDGH